MIITISPAKILNFETPAVIEKKTKPIFEKDADYLNNILKELSANEIGTLMNINPKITLDVYQYIQSFGMGRAPKKQAALAYNGMVYLGLDSKTFSESDWDFAQKHLTILSGLYGALKPLDIIHPYRLEMHTKVVNDRGTDLYAYWKKTLTEYLAKQLKANGNIWLNLASNEYSKVIDKKALGKDVRIITPSFKQDTPKGYKQIVVYAKKARGLMSRFVIQNQVKTIEDLKLFETEGYSYSPSLSKGDDWVFIR